MAMLVYDVSNIDSFKNIQKWHKKILSNPNNIPCVLVANKVDLDTRRAVSKGDGGLLAGKLNVPYFECSAKESDKVDVPFLHLAASFYEQVTKWGEICVGGCVFVCVSGCLSGFVNAQSLCVGVGCVAGAEKIF